MGVGVECCTDDSADGLEGLGSDRRWTGYGLLEVENDVDDREKVEEGGRAGLGKAQWDCAKVSEQVVRVKDK